MDDDRLKKDIEEEFPGYPDYPASEDIYSNEIKEEDINPDNFAEVKTTPDVTRGLNEKDFAHDLTGEDLDIPGAELDDFQKNLGSEDEENNYYSIGGDNHDNLDESSDG